VKKQWYRVINAAEQMSMENGAVTKIKRIDFVAFTKTNVMKLFALFA
jgi:hypothetical protein